MEQATFHFTVNGSIHVALCTGNTFVYDEIEHSAVIQGAECLTSELDKYMARSVEAKWTKDDPHAIR